MSYYGTQPEKKSVLLNSHTDVVPVDEKYWKCDAFEGIREENGDIYGRGIQDMKSVGIQLAFLIKFIKNKQRYMYLNFVNDRHIEVIRRMKQNNIRPNRTIHLSYVPGRFIFLI